MIICITSYYGLNEQLYYAANALSNYHKVIDFPLMCHSNNKNYKTLQYVDTFINFLLENDVDVILWWYISIPTNCFEKIVSSPIYKKKLINIFFNWDEPFNWTMNDIQTKAKYLDGAFVTCEETLVRYTDNGCKYAEYCLPGYEPSVHNMIFDTDSNELDKYDADISFICTNLYIGDLYNEQLIRRKDIVDTIYNNMDKYKYTFKIYGPLFLKELYPNAYNGFIKYNDTNKVFNKSKINLCTHVIGNKYKYLNERVILIAGSGGLLFVDNIKGINDVFTENEIVLIDPINYISQIDYILRNYEQFIDRRINFHQKSKIYTWDKWAEQINNFLTKFN
jgi:hypothetical protein